MKIQQWFAEKFANRAKGNAPARQLWIEVLGFFIISYGLFIGFSLFGYDSQDYEKLLAGKTNVSNWCGPLGAKFSHLLITSVGVISYVWPFALALWGSLMAFGFITKPKKRRFILFFIISFLLAGIVQVLIPNSNLEFGLGGRIGLFLGKGLSGQLGFVGALIALTFSGFASVIFTRHVSFTKIGKDHKKETPVEIQTEDTKPQAEESAEPTPNKKSSSKSKADKTTDEDAEEAEESESSINITLSPATSPPAKPDIKIFKAKDILDGDVEEENSEINELLELKLEEFKVKGEVKGVTGGPVVKTYEFEPAAGTKISKIESLQNDLARLLKTNSLRIVPVHGKSTVGFEMPNDERKVIPFGNLVQSDDFKSRKFELPIAMGVDPFGEPVIEDLAKMPHLMVAGSTGSGKSVFINTLITSLLVRNSAKDLRMILIDPKMVELGAFNDTAHMACPVITDIENDGLETLNVLVEEMEKRYNHLKELGAKNITAFNDIIKNNKKSKFKNFTGKWQTMPYVVVIVDEFADLIMTLGKDAEQAITRLAQKARAAGIHLVIATQRPSVQVVTGTIKVNFPTRVAFKVTSGVDSRTIIDQAGAETLLGNGDMLFLSSTGVRRLHSSYLGEDEISKVVKLCKKKKK